MHHGAWFRAIIIPSLLPDPCKGLLDRKLHKENIDQTKCHIETEVVPVDIPLLLSITEKSRCCVGH